MKIRALSDAIGLEILDFDINKGTDSDFEDIYDHWLDSNILLFRNQSLTEEQQISFGERFGEISQRMDRKGIAKPESDDMDERVILITNIRKDGVCIGTLPDGALGFHFDGASLEKPYKAALLYCIECAGGNTIFSNMYKAYDAVGDDLKEKLKDEKFFNGFRLGYVGIDGTEEDWLTMPIDMLTSYAENSVFNMHPDTGRNSLYISPIHSRHVVGMEPEESKKTVAHLREIAEREEFRYEHVWKPGDIIVWDNRCTLHGRTDFKDDQVRLLRRVAISA